MGNALRLKAEEHFIQTMPSPEESTKMVVGLLEFEHINSKIWYANLSILLPFLRKASNMLII